ncbi:MAG: hypothetical protein M1821_003264 [Bathelium mastoideum]|nr:MAG: hypothetical protein M1821_003264 [Bathelium mastoideum]KAI9689378.1 MAG: hypothetical protein M1822_010029 [Bathelium mastoideum]
MADVRDILARMASEPSPETGQAQNPIWASQPTLQQRQSYHQPSVSSPIFSPQPGGPQPIHSSAILSPALPGSSSATPHNDSGNRANLLNLLRFAPPSQDSSRSSIGVLNPQLERGRPASMEQAVSFVSKPPLPSMLSRPDMRGESTPANADDPQHALLKLLNSSASSQSRTASGFGGRIERNSSEDLVVTAAATDKLQEPQEAVAEVADIGSGTGTVKKSVGREEPRMRVFGSEEPENSTNLRGSIFNYVNPFNELSASSPQTRTPQPENQKAALGSRAELLKHDRDPSSGTHVIDDFGTSMPLPKSRKLSPGASREAPSREASLVGDGRSPLEALMDIGTEKAQRPIQPEALSEVVEKLDEQVEEAMSELKIDPASQAQHENEKVLKSDKGLHELKDEVQEVAKEMREELKDKKTKKEFEKSVSPEVAQAVEDTVEDIVQGVPEDWEDMDESAVVNPHRVFTFPMRPFHAIDIQPMQSAKPGLRENGVMDIARFKKDFDQLDRNLATATKTYIVYAALKHGGFRLIHQGSGKDKHVFRGSSNAERIFNIAVCSGAAPSPYADMDAVIATGLNGSVYWTLVDRTLGDSFDDKNLDKEGFILPPSPGTDDNTSGAQLKTRAKPSSRHVEYFAIGRGKSIHIVWPYTIRTRDYTDVKTRITDTGKLFAHQQLVISTGKAAKDFAFSEDDTVIVSLDKAGRIKFWDIRDMVDAANPVPAPPRSPIELRLPKLTFSTTAPNEKSWPTSIMFIDKERPYIKGGAMRYLLVGFKQNHTLQLWDLGLKKAVQEINFPQDKETDPICSLAYHPRTGVLALGHPTRNSIYLIHVSCPKYVPGHMSQARYISRLALQDPTLPSPESTAIMSGVRELSFASKGQLRSLSMQDKPISDNDEDEAMFELYIMHSKGVTCLTITKSDIGWTKETKPINPVNGEKEGYIVVRDLQPSPSAAPSEPSVNGDSLAPAPTHKKLNKNSRASGTATPEPMVGAAGVVRHAEKQSVGNVAPTNGASRSDKKLSEESSVTRPEGKATSPTRASLLESRPREARPTSPSINPSNPSISEIPKSRVTHQPVENTMNRAANPGATDQPPVERMADVTRGMAREFASNVNEQLVALHHRLDEDRRVQDAAGNAKHDAVLRLVSSTLTENVDNSLNRIISTNIQESLLPTIADATAKSVDRKLPPLLGEHLRINVPKEIKAALPGAISTAVQSPNVIRSISDHLTEKITQHVERQIHTSLTQSIMPAFNNAAAQEVHTVAGQLETRVAEALRKVDFQRAQDNHKIEQLTGLVRSLTETVATMANSQANFQAEILKLQNQVAQQQPAQKPIGSERAAGATSRSATEPEAELTQQHAKTEDDEIKLITKLLHDGKYEEGTITWLRSEHQVSLFNRLFYRVNPPYLSRLNSPLIPLSCAAAVSQTFSNHVMERLNWLDAALDAIEYIREQANGRHDDDLREVSPNIMDVLAQRLQKLYVQVANEGIVANADEAHRRIAMLAHRVKQFKDSLGYEMGMGR